MAKKKAEKETAERGEKLQGIDAISRHLRKSPCTTLKLWRERALPMAKLGGVWEAWSGHLDDWHEEQIRREVRQIGERMVG